METTTVLKVSRYGRQLTEIRDLLTVYHEIVRSGKQKNPEIDGLENDRSRHPERRLTCPDMFLIRSPRA